MRKKIILAGGCFNSLHPGHIYFLKEAKKLGDELIVVVSNDKNNKKPYALSAGKRKEALENLRIADKVLIGNPNNKDRIVKELKPDLIVLGYDQKLPRGLNGFAYFRIGNLEGHSTNSEKKGQNKT